MLANPHVNKRPFRLGLGLLGHQDMPLPHNVLEVMKRAYPKDLVTNNIKICKTIIPPKIRITEMKRSPAVQY